jgi:hypothetical protein
MAGRILSRALSWVCLRFWKGALTFEVQQGRFCKSRADRWHNSHRNSGDSVPGPVGFIAFSQKHSNKTRRCHEDIAHAPGPLRHLEPAPSLPNGRALMLNPECRCIWIPAFAGMTSYRINHYGLLSPSRIPYGFNPLRRFYLRPRPPRDFPV